MSNNISQNLASFNYYLESTGSKSKSLGDVTFKTADGKAVSVAAKVLGSQATAPSQGRGKSDTIKLSVNDEKNQFVEVEVKVKDLAKSLGISKQEVRDADQKGHLSNLIEKQTKAHASLAPPSVTKQTMDPGVRQKILDNIQDYGLTEAEFHSIESYYQSCIDNKTFENIDKTTFIKRNEPTLPRSLVYIPNGPKKGLHVLLKTHGGLEEVGIGAFNRATLSLHLDTGENKVLRNARKEDVKDNEIEANKRTSQYPQHFVSGDVFEYQGDWRERGGRGKNFSIIPQANIPKETNIQKVGIILNHMEGGELAELIDKGPINSRVQIQIAKEYADAMAVMADLNLVHLDQKPENTFLTSDGHAKVADFGYTVETGTPITGSLNGTPGYMAPEYVEAILLSKTTYIADPAADVWSMGCVFARMGSEDWSDICIYDNAWNFDVARIGTLSEAEIENLKEACFADRHTPGTLDYVIDQCLQRDPAKRPSAREVAEMLAKL